MIVEPRAGDRVEDNLNPVGRAYYGFSTLLCTPASLSQEVGLALGAQAGEARIRDVVTSRRLHALPPRGGDAVQPRVRGAAVTAPRSTGSGAGSTRARQPDSDGLRRARRRPRPLRGLRQRRARPCCCCRLVDRPLARTGRCRCRTWRATSGWSRSTAAATAARTGPRDPRPTRRSSIAADALAVLDATRHRARPSSSGISCGARRRCCSRPTTPSACRRRLHRRLRAVRARARRGAGGDLVRRASSTPTTAGRKYNRHYWLARLRRLPRVLLLADVHRAALDQADRGLRRLGPADHARRRDRRRSSRSGLDRGDCAASSRGRVRCPVLVIHGTDDAIRSHRAGAALAELTGGVLVGARGLRPRAARARSGAVNLLMRDFADDCRRRAGRAGARAGSRRKRALFVSSPIGLGHARRDVAIADELRRLHPDLEIDWLAQHPVTARARGARRAHPPRQRGARQRVAPHRVARRPSTTCTASRRCGGWTRSCSRTSWSSTTSCATTRTTSGSATRPGSSTTSCTRTPS